MRISALNILKISVFSVALSAIAPKTQALPHQKQDSFEMVFNKPLPAKGSNDQKFLKFAPNPDVLVQNKKKKAIFVVDLSKNHLYQYDKSGKAIWVYPIASGKKSTPTHTGVRVVSHVESYPYRGAPKTSKRRKTPRAFGPKIIILDKLDTKTGEKFPTGEFIHGNNNPSSIGKYASHGCMRMDNEVIKQLAKVVERDDIVLIKK